MKAEQDTIIQKRMQLEDFEFMDFFAGVIEDCGFSEFGCFSEIRSRAVCYDCCSGCGDHLTDDKVHQLLVMDCLVAMVYERRTEMNFIEATYVVSAKGIRWARYRLRDYYKDIRNK